MRRLTAIGAVVAFALAAGLLAGCGSASTSTSGSGGGSSSAGVIKVGVVSDFSFPLDVDYVKELKVLVDSTNANGGLDVGGTKYKVEVVSYDSKGSPETGRSAVQRLITQDKVNFILGDTTSGWLALGHGGRQDARDRRQPIAERGDPTVDTRIPVGPLHDTARHGVGLDQRQCPRGEDGGRRVPG